MACTVSADLESLLSGQSCITDLRNDHEGIVHAYDLASDVDLMADSIRKLLQVRNGTVLLGSFGGIQFLIQLLSVLKAGGCPVITSPLTSVAALQHIVASARPSLALGAAPFLRTIGRLSLPFEAALIPGYQQDLPCYCFAPGSFKKVEADTESCVVLTSSGTTGHPKLVVHSFRSLLRNAIAHAEALDYKKGARVVHHLPCHYSFGLVAGLISSLSAGIDVVFSEEDLRMSRLSLLCHERDTDTFLTTPFTLRQMLSTGDRFPQNLQKLAIGGDHTAPADVERLREKYDGEIFLTYGLSEAGPRVATNKIGAFKNGWSLLGRPVGDAEFRIVTMEDGAEQDASGGELYVRSSTLMKGYLSDGRLHSPVDVDGWLPTGDIVEPVGSGDLRFVARKKQVIIIGGRKVFPGVIRDVILECPYVDDAAVSSFVNSTSDLQLSAVIKLYGVVDGDPRELITSHLRSRLRAHEVPGDIIFRDDIGRTSK